MSGHKDRRDTEQIEKLKEENQSLHDKLDKALAEIERFPRNAGIVAADGSLLFQGQFPEA